MSSQSQAVRQAREILERWQASDLFDRITSSDVIPEQKSQPRIIPAALPQPERRQNETTASPEPQPAPSGPPTHRLPQPTAHSLHPSSSTFDWRQAASSLLERPKTPPAPVSPNPPARTEPGSQGVIRQLPPLPLDLLAPAPVVATASSHPNISPVSSPPQKTLSKDSTLPNNSSDSDQWDPPPRINADDIHANPARSAASPHTNDPAAPATLNAYTERPLSKHPQNTLQTAERQNAALPADNSTVAGEPHATPHEDRSDSDIAAFFETSAADLFPAAANQQPADHTPADRKTSSPKPAAEKSAAPKPAATALQTPPQQIPSSSASQQQQPQQNSPAPAATELNTQPKKSTPADVPQSTQPAPTTTQQAHSTQPDPPTDSQPLPVPKSPETRPPSPTARTPASQTAPNPVPVPPVAVVPDAAVPLVAATPPQKPVPITPPVPQPATVQSSTHNSPSLSAIQTNTIPSAAAAHPGDFAESPVILPASQRRNRPALQRSPLNRRLLIPAEPAQSSSGTISMNRNSPAVSKGQSPVAPPPVSAPAIAPVPPAAVSNSPETGVRERRDAAEPGGEERPHLTTWNRTPRYCIDERHESPVRGPHFELAPPPRSNFTSIIGQALAYIGVIALLIGTSLVILGHFGGESDYTPTGWLITTVAQMLLFLGIINLVSGGMEQHNDEVARRIHSLSEHLIRIEQTTADAVRAAGRDREDNAASEARENTSVSA